jgi:hypothetical protein
LQGKHIEFEKVDISLVEGAKEKMREICGETTLPPQICKGDTCLGVSFEMLIMSWPTSQTSTHLVLEKH